MTVWDALRFIVPVIVLSFFAGGLFVFWMLGSMPKVKA